MFQKILIAGVASLSLGAPAWAVTFSAVQYGTTATATAESVTETNSAASPPTASLPLFSAATAAGLNDFANAAAVSGEGLLSASSYADSLLNGASASGQSRFVGSFSDAGRWQFSFDFGSADTVLGGTGGATLFVELTSTVGATTSTLFSNTFTVAGNHVFTYDLAAGSTSQLDVRLVSSAATSGAMQTGQNFAQAAFAVTAVPEPSTWALLAFGVAGLALLQRRRQRAHEAATA